MATEKGGEKKRRRKRSRKSSEKSNKHDTAVKEVEQSNELQDDTKREQQEHDTTKEQQEHDTTKEQQGHDDAVTSEPNAASEEHQPGDSTKPKRKRKRKRKSKQPSQEEREEDASNTTITTKLSSVDLTVYVEGIPFDASEDNVRDFFLSNGCADILQLRLPRWQDSGRLRGYGHVVFDSEASRNKAVTHLSGQNMGSRYLTIQPAKAPRADTSMGAVQQRSVRDQPNNCKTVFCKNLPYHASEEDVAAVFQVCGRIVEGGVRIARNYNTRESKGFAYVEYKHPEGAYAAVLKASKPFGMTVLGRPCFVDYDEGTIKGSFKTAQGRLWSREYGAHSKKQQRYNNNNNNK